MPLEQKSRKRKYNNKTKQYETSKKKPTYSKVGYQKRKGGGHKMGPVSESQYKRQTKTGRLRVPYKRPQTSTMPQPADLTPEQSAGAASTIASNVITPGSDTLSVAGNAVRDMEHAKLATSLQTPGSRADDMVQVAADRLNTIQNDPYVSGFTEDGEPYYDTSMAMIGPNGIYQATSRIAAQGATRAGASTGFKTYFVQTGKTTSRRTAAEPVANAKNWELAKQGAAELLGPKNWAKLGAATIAFWAGSVGLGLWGGKAEVAESYTIDSNRLYEQALKTGNRTFYDMNREGAIEAMDINAFETAVLASPLSMFKGSNDKGQNIKTQSEIKFAADDFYWDFMYGPDGQKSADGSSSGGGTPDLWMAYQQFKEESQARIAKNDADVRIATEQQLMRERDALNKAQTKREREAIKQSIADWEAYAARQRKEEELNRIEQAEYWLKYQQRLQELQSADSRTNLNFGLL